MYVLCMFFCICLVHPQHHRFQEKERVELKQEVRTLLQRVTGMQNLEKVNSELETQVAELKLAIHDMEEKMVIK